MTPHVKDDIKRDEGLRLKAYPDPDSGGEPWTCGYGCTGADITPETVWTQAEADARFELKFAEAVRHLDEYLPWWRQLDDVRQDVLVNMCFNMGIGNDLHGLRSFHNTLQRIRNGDYGGAAAGMLTSKWARQVKKRANRLATMMATGVSQ